MNQLKKKFFCKEKGTCLLKNPWTDKANLHKNKNFHSCVKHLITKHKQEFSLNPLIRTISITQPITYYYFIKKYNDLYLINVVVKDKVICSTVNRLNLTHYATREDRFYIEFKWNDTVVAHFGRVCLNNKRCDSDNDYVVVTKLEGLRQILKSTKNVEITVKVNTYVMCCTCKDLVNLKFTASKFVNPYGWYCLKCCTHSIHCAQCNTWDGDNYLDIVEKQKKHTLFFCPRRDICFICRQSLEESPISHYENAHKDITYQTGEKFCVNETEGCYLLLQHESALMICRYSCNHNGFSFSIRSPRASRFICNYRCKILVNSTLYYLEPLVKQFNDWHIDIKSVDHKNWTCPFDISIDLEEKVSDQ